MEMNNWPKLETWQFKNLFQETSIDSIAEEAPASAVEEVAEVAEEEDGDAEEAEIEAEEKYFEKLEKKEQMEEKMLTTRLVLNRPHGSFYHLLLFTAQVFHLLVFFTNWFNWTSSLLSEVILFEEIAEK